MVIHIQLKCFPCFLSFITKLPLSDPLQWFLGEGAKTSWERHSEITQWWLSLLSPEGPYPQKTLNHNNIMHRTFQKEISSSPNTAGVAREVERGKWREKDRCLLAPLSKLALKLPQIFYGIPQSCLQFSLTEFYPPPYFWNQNWNEYFLLRIIMKNFYLPGLLAHEDSHRTLERWVCTCMHAWTWTNTHAHTHIQRAICRLNTQVVPLYCHRR